MQLLKSDYGALSPLTQILMVFGALLIVAFGQPAWVPPLGLIAAVCGYAMLWRVMFCWESRSFRFWVATLWFTALQLVQLSWMTSDEYQGKYIYLVWLFLSLGLGLQFGLVSLVIRRGSLKSIGRVAAISFLWVLMEWSRLFFFSGFTWNPVGIALTGAIYPMQLAAIGGVYGLSFWVFFTNLLFLRSWALSDEIRALAVALLIAAAPYLFGYGHILYHESWESGNPIRTLLVQTAQPPQMHAKETALAQWGQVIENIKKFQGRQLDLVVLPEAMVPYGTYDPIYRFEEVEALLKENLQGLMMPRLVWPLAFQQQTPDGTKWWVSNAYIAQAISNAMDADLVAGLEDEEQARNYNAAFYFTPYSHYQYRYEKRVLVPMGEYIPFEWAASIAATYGIQGSFTPGQRAKVFKGAHAPPIGLSICYEETYGDLIRESRMLGAELLVNVTNDVWYPNSRLPKQHFDHARLRSVENGVPLVRACNTGITGGFDSLGRVVGVLGEDGVASEWTADAIYLDVPSYHYKTLYSQLGDGFIIGLALIFSGVAFRFKALTFS